jgi:hypothetical protein
VAASQSKQLKCTLGVKTNWNVQASQRELKVRPNDAQDRVVQCQKTQLQEGYHVSTVSKVFEKQKPLTKVYRDDVLFEEEIS